MPRWFISLYSLLWGLLLPFAFFRLLWRSRSNPAYRLHWGERLGLGFPPAADLLIHAVSVGEARAAAPLVRALLAEGHRVLITCTTPTGRATLASLFDDQVAIRYLPFDAPWLIGPWLGRLSARTVLLVETELWPGLCDKASRAGIALLLVNGRLSEKSARGYRRAGRLGRALVGCLSAIGAQSAEDAHRFDSLGARSVVVTGNLKFDVAPPDDLDLRAVGLRAHLDVGRDRPLWVAASTRDGEEERLLRALASHA
ncbi:MAG: glycosyltransferase N-terminal domain-containing protein, partial [Casimicrobiaceae bacterium]